MQQLTEQALPSEKDLRAYATAETGWEVMRDKGFTFDQVLAGLGSFGLRMPTPDTPQSRQAHEWLTNVIQEDRARKERTLAL